MSARPTVSLFVQAYQTRAWVGECVESLLRLRDPAATEVIVIDDASPDGTADVVAGLSDPRLRLIRHARNLGATATADEGYRLCRGDLVARIDSDDRVRPTFLSSAVPLFEAREQVGLVYGDIAMIDPAGACLSPRENVQREGRPLVGNELFPLLLRNFVPAPATLVRRTALAPLLPLPPWLKFVDWYVSTGIAERWDLAFVPEVLADYRLHTANMHRTMIKDRTGEETTFRVLDRLLDGPHREDEKRCWRDRVRAENFLVYADKYFGSGMVDDARRCYLEALRHRPRWAVRPDVARRLAGTLMGLERYEAGKRALKRVAARLRGGA